jgi:hypothetical protein
MSPGAAGHGGMSPAPAWHETDEPFVCKPGPPLLP